MISISIAMAVFIIAIGFFIGKNPDMISGYNTMSAEKKKNVEMDKVGRLLSRSLYVAGAITLAGTLAAKIAGRPDIALHMMIWPLLLIVMYALVRVQKFDHNPRKAWLRVLPAAIIGIITVGVAMLLLAGSKPHQVTVDDSGVTISGQYGVTIAPDKIASVSQSEHLPAITMRINGVSTGAVNKGWYKSPEYGRIRLFTHTRYTGPFILIKTTEGETTIFQTPDPESTEELLRQIERIR